MGRITRSSDSKRDLAQIACYIAEDNPIAAERWLDSVDKLLKLISHNPLMGEEVTSLQRGLRRYSHGRYVVYYRPQPDGILLYRVLHGARKIEDLLR